MALWGLYHRPDRSIPMDIIELYHRPDRSMGEHIFCTIIMRFNLHKQAYIGDF